MQFKLNVALAAFSVLAIQAQEVRVGVAGAIRNATEQYNTTNARLSEIRSDCKRDGLVYTANCNRTLACVARDITQANIYLQDANKSFRPKVNCAYISNEFNRLQGRIIFVNEQLRQRACSTAPLTKVAVTLNANAIRDAILEQLERINALGLRFAANDACNRPQTPQALAKFKSYIDAVKADDTKTAQSFSLVEGVLDTLNCALDEL